MTELGSTVGLGVADAGCGDAASRGDVAGCGGTAGRGDVAVSVIVPVYNTAAYLRECLDSLVGQTLRNIEIICVDDGSTDESPAILEEYAARDGRVRVLRQENQGAGAARNNGLARACGTYVMFCDSDDFMAAEALELLWIQCEQDDADVCVCAGERFYESFGLTVASPGYLEVKRLPEQMPFNRHSNAEHLFSFTTIMMFNKMFRRQFLLDHGLRYGTTRNGEDVEICAFALWYAERITVVRKPLVTYRIDRPDSLVGTLSASATDPLRSWMRVWDAIGSELGEARRSFDCKFLGVIRHGFRNVTTAEAFSACYDYVQADVLPKVGFRPHAEGYYYTPWYNVFVTHLLDDSLQDFATFMLYTASRELEAEEARKLDERRKLRTETVKLKAADKKLGNLDKQLAGEKKAFDKLVKENKELARKFSKVEGIYRAGAAVRRTLRKAKRRI